MSSFAFELGRTAAKRRTVEKRDQVEPLLGGDFLAEWRRGYGGEGVQRCLKNDGSTADAASGQFRSKDSAVSASAKPPRQAALFDAGQPSPKTREKTQTGIRPKPPTPVPQDDIEQEIGLLVSIGIGLTEAEDLVRKQQWTLDQMVCQWQLGNEAGLPQHVIGRVARYGQQRWGVRHDVSVNTNGVKSNARTED